MCYSKASRYTALRYAASRSEDLGDFKLGPKNFEIQGSCILAKNS